MNGINYTNDPRAVLIHFNPNHDKLGRFAKSHFRGSRIESKPVDKSGVTKYNKDKREKKNNKQFDWKKAAKTGAVVAGVALATIGTAYLVKSGKLVKLVNVGRDSTDNVLRDIGSQPIQTISGGSGIASNETIKSFIQTAKSPDHIDADMVQRINGSGIHSEPGRDINCAHTSVAYLLNSIFGKDVVAKPFSGVDEISGYVGTWDRDKRMVTGLGRDENIFKAVFDGLKYKSCNPVNESLSDVLSRQNPGTGIIKVVHPKGVHYVNYEKSRDGIISIIDGQNGEIIFGADGLKYIERMYKYRPLTLIDATNAVLRNDKNAVDVINAMVK